MKFVRPQMDKLQRSALISMCGALLGIGFLLVLRYLFPNYDATEIQAGIFVAISAWIVNLVKESING